MQDWFPSSKPLVCQFAETIMKIHSMDQEPLIFRAKLRLEVLRHCWCCNEPRDSDPSTPDRSPMPSGPELRSEQGGWLRRLRCGKTTSRTPKF
jgi:hypothetical protein